MTSPADKFSTNVKYLARSLRTKNALIKRASESSLKFSSEQEYYSLANNSLPLKFDLSLFCFVVKKIARVNGGLNIKVINIT